MEIKFGKKFIGDIHPTFIVAEMSANHDGDKRKAIEMIHVAKDMGADAIKLQTYSADSMTLDVDNKDFNLLPESPWATHKNLWNLYTKGSTPYDWHEDLFKEARNIDLEIFSTPFDEYGVDFLMDLGVSAFKIASPEINHIPLIRKICETGKPIILSSGVADLKDITLAIDTIRNNQPNADIILMQCNSSYPSPYEDLNLLTIKDYKNKFNVLTGFSDHSEGIHCAIASVCLGADIIEKHFSIEGQDTIDSFFSIYPDQFNQMVSDIRDIELALGKVTYDITESALQSIGGRRSIYASADIRKGDLITEMNIKCVRPSHSLHPKHYEEIIGKHAKKDLKKGDRLKLDYFE